MRERDDRVERYGYGDAGHAFDPARDGRCRKASSGYCDGTRTDPQHDDRSYYLNDLDGPDNTAGGHEHWDDGR